MSTLGIKTNFEIVGLLGNIFLLNMPDYGEIRQFFTDFSSFPPFAVHFCGKRTILSWSAA